MHAINLSLLARICLPVAACIALACACVGSSPIGPPGSQQIDTDQGTLLLGNGHAQDGPALGHSSNSLTFSDSSFIDYDGGDNSLQYDYRVHKTWSPVAPSLLDAPRQQQRPLANNLASLPLSYNSGYAMASFGVMDDFSIRRLLVAIAPELVPVLAIVIIFGLLTARDRRRHHADQ